MVWLHIISTHCEVWTDLMKGEHLPPSGLLPNYSSDSRRAAWSFQEDGEAQAVLTIPTPYIHFKYHLDPLAFLSPFQTIQELVFVCFLAILRSPSSPSSGLLFLLNVSNVSLSSPVCMTQALN